MNGKNTPNTAMATPYKAQPDGIPGATIKTIVEIILMYLLDGMFRHIVYLIHTGLSIFKGQHAAKCKPSTGLQVIRNLYHVTLPQVFHRV